MTAIALPLDAHPMRRQRLPAPVPHETPPGRLALLMGLRKNPVATWSRVHYELPVVQGPGILGYLTVLNAPEGVRRLFLDNAANYPKDDLQQRILSPGLGDGLLTAEGDAWRQQRRTLAPLFTPRKIASFTGQMQEGSDRLVARMLRRGEGGTVDVMEEMTRVTFDILSSTLFSGTIAGDADAFGRAMTRYFSTQGRIDPLDLMGAPDWLPRIGRILARPAIQYFQKQMQETMRRRRAQIDAGGAPPPDILTALLEAADPETGKGLTEAEIGANITTFIGAGHETTANTLTWALYLLSRAPDIRDRVEQEADAVFEGGRSVAEWPDAMPMTRAVIEETMRLYPAASTLSRKALEEDTLAGYTIPKGSLVIVSPWLLHRHKSLWTDPELFVPERFLPDNREKIERFAYLPFGAGPRICIGMGFAMQEMAIVLAHILHRMRLTYGTDGVPEPVQRITLKPDGGMPMRLERR